MTFLSNGAGESLQRGKVHGVLSKFYAANARFGFRIPDDAEPIAQAPMLCAGLIGYRALRMAGEGSELGFYGFGAAAHLLTQVACYQGRRGYAFARESEIASQRFAFELGAAVVT